MKELDVILKTHHYLKTSLLVGQFTSRLFTDTHTTLLPYSALQPFQRFTLEMGDFVLHPDLVGQLEDGATLYAIEAKGNDDLIKGLSQAEMYQTGFHFSFLVADSASLGSTMVNIARKKNIGIMAVSDDVKILHLPEPHMPIRKSFEFILRQMETVIQISQGQTFTFNIPTHYLVWATALDAEQIYDLRAVPDLLNEYPMPKGWRGSLAGAKKLGLVIIQGNRVSLTETGKAAKEILPKTLEEWSEIHEVVGAKVKPQTLVQYAPMSAAVLRLLLLQDPMVRLVISGLQMFSSRSANFSELAIACDKLDHASTPIFFLRPESIQVVMDEYGKIDWKKAKGEDYRSSTFYQYKSILKHAGILKETRLGGSTAKGYDPLNDIWALR
jgi:hypothetical protein